MITARQLLVPEAVILKKSWIIAALMIHYIPQGEEGIIYDYSSWNKQALFLLIKNLKSKIYHAFKQLLINPRQGLQGVCSRNGKNRALSRFGKLHES